MSMHKAISCQDRGMFVAALQSVHRGDVVVGLVSAIQDGGMLVTLECLDYGGARDIHALKINVS